MSEIIIPSSPADRQKIKLAIEEMVKCMLRIDDEKSAMKDIMDELEEKYDLPKKIVRKMAKAMYKSNVEEEKAESDEFFDVYDAIIENTQTVVPASTEE